MRKSAEAKRALRQANLAPERPGKSCFFLPDLSCFSLQTHMPEHVDAHAILCSALVGS